MKRWLSDLIADPDGSPSSTRVAALLCTVVACLVALAGVALAREQSATVMALLTGGAAAFFTRTKSDGPGGTP